MSAASGTDPRAKVTVTPPDGVPVTATGSGDGPIDSVFAAINAATGIDAQLRVFRVDAVTGGQDALGESSVVLEYEGQSASGPGRGDGHHRGGRTAPTCARCRTSCARRRPPARRSTSAPTRPFRRPDRRRAVTRAALSSPRDRRAAIEVDGLRKSYGAFEAVRGVSLRVQRGEIFAFLGPNGAGKTTTVEILEGFRKRDAGEVRVLGVDPEHGNRDWRARIGIVLQEGRAQPNLTVRETLELWSAYYPDPRPIAETIDLVGLSEKADARVARLSGGQRRRLDVALALVGRPDLVFLDEPTTGFDPVARRSAWEVIAGLRELGTTVFLTTHYLDEAQELADRVAIIKGGVIVAEGAPQDLTGPRRAGDRDRVRAAGRGAR